MNKPSHWASRFGLKKNPFKDTIDSELFFRTRQHEEALVKMKIGIEDQHALIMLSGISGTGKTLASQMVLRSLDPTAFTAAFVFVFPGMAKGSLLGAILSELEVKPARFVFDRLAQVQEQAMTLSREGRRLVIIIDEAHFLKADALHILRTLSNLETEQEKLVTVLLVAEKNLSKRLRAPSYASLRSRITFAVTLEPLSVEELEQYIKYRLLKCGGDVTALPAEAYTLVHELCQGIPREANRLLYAGFVEAMSSNGEVNAAVIESAARKMGFLHS